MGAKEPAGRLLPRRFDEATGDYKATWEPFKERQPTDAELVKWFSTDAAQLAIVTGVASGGVVVLDFDVGDAYHDWYALVSDLVAQELLDQLPVVKSRQGYHVYFRMPNPIGNRKLAWRERTVLVETRGQGGYILAPPSRHPSGVAYELIRGNLLEIPLLNAEDVRRLVVAIIAGDVTVEPSPETNEDRTRREWAILLQVAEPSFGGRFPIRALAQHPDVARANIKRDRVEVLARRLDDEGILQKQFGGRPRIIRAHSSHWNAQYLDSVRRPASGDIR